jgi:hypothetical protein
LVIVNRGKNQSRIQVIGTNLKFHKYLEGLVGKCAGILVFDEKNLVLGADSYKNEVLLWDIVTGSLLMNCLIPEFFPSSIPICLESTKLDNLSFAIGFTNKLVA